jgi:plastocyanin
MRKTFAALAAAAALGMLPAAPAGASGGGGCGEPVTEGSGSTVAIRQFCFSPTILSAPTGTEVTFTNEDPIRHGVLGANAAWGSFELLRGGRSAVYTFSEPGVYPYVCVWHPGMVGAVVVGQDRIATVAGPGGNAAAVTGAQATRSSSWKAVAVAASGLLALVLIGAAGMRRRAEA